MILIVDDNEIHREALANILRLKGYRVRQARSVVEAVEKINEKVPSLLVLDLMMSPIPGADLLKHFEEIIKQGTMKAVITTGIPQATELSILKEMPNIKVLQKPFHSEDLEDLVEKLAPLEKPQPR